jgi:hypothetical protein
MHLMRAQRLDIARLAPAPQLRDAEQERAEAEQHEDMEEAEARTEKRHHRGADGDDRNHGDEHGGDIAAAHRPVPQRALR